MERCKQAIKYIAETFTTTEDTSSSTSKKGLGDVLIVCHAATKVGLVRGITGDPEQVVNCATCSLTKLVRKPTTVPNEYKWETVLNGETSYLSGGSQYLYRYTLFQYYNSKDLDGSFLMK
jgi:hypothetical protein